MIKKGVFSLDPLSVGARKACFGVCKTLGEGEGGGGGTHTTRIKIRGRGSDEAPACFLHRAKTAGSRGQDEKSKLITGGQNVPMEKSESVDIGRIAGFGGRSSFAMKEKGEGGDPRKKPAIGLLRG